MNLDGSSLLEEKPNNTETEDRDASFEADRDSLHILPLALLPLTSSTLRRAKLVKNVRMESAVEFFNDGTSGSGQYDINEIHCVLDMPKKSAHPDMKILRGLGELPSYDVYSLRILLREHAIPVNDFSELKLSDKKKQEVAEYMATFTRPLITHIFGKDAAKADIRDASDLMKMFQTGDPALARRNLVQLSQILKTELMDVPRFIEDYGDIFLSISYFKHCLDTFSAGFADICAVHNEILENYQVKNDPRLAEACNQAISLMRKHERNIRNKLNAFDRSSAELWENISAENFHRISQIVRGEHIQVASVLCGLTVKLASFRARFPNIEVAGTVKMAEYIGFEMRQHLDELTENAKRQAHKAA